MDGRIWWPPADGTPPPRPHCSPRRFRGTAAFSGRCDCLPDLGRKSPEPLPRAAVGKENTTDVFFFADGLNLAGLGYWASGQVWASLFDCVVRAFGLGGGTVVCWGQLGLVPVFVSVGGALARPALFMGSPCGEPWFKQPSTVPRNSPGIARNRIPRNRIVCFNTENIIPGIGKSGK